MSKIYKFCLQCGAEYETYREQQKYCSRKCNLSRMNTDPEHQRRAGEIGGKVRGAQLSAEATSGWYLKQDGEHIHRTVAEAVLQRPLRRGEVVHHEDQNKHNNHPSNLIVFPSQAVHARHHGRGHCQKPCDCPGIRLKEVMPNEAS